MKSLIWDEDNNCLLIERVLQRCKDKFTDPPQMNENWLGYPDERSDMFMLDLKMGTGAIRRGVDTTLYADLNYLISSMIYSEFGMTVL